MADQTLEGRALTVFPSPLSPEGIALRDYFAAAALAGIATGAITDSKAPNMARQAYQLADAMLAERARGAK